MTEISSEKSAVSVGKPADFVRETDYRLATFLEWSASLKGQRVALYGSGANVHHILEAQPGFEVDAVVDDGAVGKVVDGRTVSSLDDALAGGIDAIVVAAEFASGDFVFRRIGDRCHDAGVRIFDMYGNDWDMIDAEVELAFEQPLEAQLAEIESCEALCINIDLLHDDCSRITVSECVRGLGDVGQCLGAVVAFELARGKRIAYYSNDARVDVETASAMLAEAGLAGTGPLFLAAGTGLFAENGLHRLMYDSLHAGNVLHVGADVYRDCLIPLCYGKKSVLTGFLKMPNHVRLASLKDEPVPQGAWYDEGQLQACNPSEMRLAACVREAMPRVADAVGESASRISAVVAPLVIGFVAWLAGCFEKDAGAYDEVLFASRDGFLVKEVYDIARGENSGGTLPPSRYFYTSRKASRAAIDSDVERDCSLKYFASCGLGLGKTYAFVEFVGAGTCQRQLERFTPFHLKGFYFGSRIGDIITRGLDASLYFGQDHASFFSRYLVLEPYLSSCEPSLRGFDAEAAPVFGDEYRTDEELKALHDVHEGVIQLAREYFTRWYEPGESVSPSFVNAIMPHLDLCDTDCMTLVDDLSGRALSKQVDTSIVAVFGGGASADASLEQTDNPLRDASALLLRLLDAFDAVCEEFNLTYVASHGTLLGAVRDGGFVPGDDDLDVVMPRRDYDLFCQLAEQGVFPSPFHLQTPENDPANFYGGYAKLRDLSPEARAFGDNWYYPDEGIKIDIMPLDNCPTDDEARDHLRHWVRRWQRLLYAKVFPWNRYLLADVSLKRLSAYYILADKMSHSLLCRGLRAACTACEPTGQLTVFAGNYTRRGNAVVFDQSDVEQAVRIPFAGTTIPIPRNAEEWLASYYGEGWRSAGNDSEQGEARR